LAARQHSAISHFSTSAISHSSLGSWLRLPRVVATGVMRVSGLMQPALCGYLGAAWVQGICGAWLALSTFSELLNKYTPPGPAWSADPAAASHFSAVTTTCVLCLGDCLIACFLHTRLARLRVCVLCLGDCLIVCHPAHASCFLLHAVMTICLRVCCMCYTYRLLPTQQQPLYRPGLLRSACL
jgi:hypothetical protein